MTQLLLKPKDAAAALAISERTLWTMKQTGEIPFVQVRGGVRYRVADLDAWCAEQSQHVPEAGDQM